MSNLHLQAEEWGLVEDNCDSIFLNPIWLLKGTPPIYQRWASSFTTILLGIANIANCIYIRVHVYKGPINYKGLCMHAVA